MISDSKWCHGWQVGVVKAEELAALHQKPLLRIHHMEAHALVARLNPDEQVWGGQIGCGQGKGPDDESGGKGHVMIGLVVRGIFLASSTRKDSIRWKCWGTQRYSV